MSPLLDGIALKLRTQLHDVPSLSRPVHHEERDLGHDTRRLCGLPFAIHWIETENSRGTKLDPASTCVERRCLSATSLPCRQCLWADALTCRLPQKESWQSLTPQIFKHPQPPCNALSRNASCTSHSLSKKIKSPRQILCPCSSHPCRPHMTLEYAVATLLYDVTRSSTPTASSSRNHNPSCKRGPVNISSELVWVPNPRLCPKCS